MRHLEAAGLIPSAGSLASRGRAFEQIAVPILESPAYTFPWTLGGLPTRGFLSTYQGQRIAMGVVTCWGRAGAVPETMLRRCR